MIGHKNRINHKEHFAKPSILIIAEAIPGSLEIFLTKNSQVPDMIFGALSDQLQCRNSLSLPRVAGCMPKRILESGCDVNNLNI
mmetsp:Transcript_27282/g.40157  ORF Transcript_27282/g.40157 Transcript_27282/m.40157 type:complete len:84 (+) Transcript_27282:355-606(+)